MPFHVTCNEEDNPDRGNKLKLNTNAILNLYFPANDFGQSKILEKSLGARNLNSFMAETVAPALGIDASNVYDSWRSDVIQAFRSTFMIPAVSQGIIFESALNNIYI